MKDVYFLLTELPKGKQIKQIKDVGFSFLRIEKVEYLIIFVISKSRKLAQKKLTSMVENNCLKIIPTSIDFLELNNVVYILKSVIKGRFLLNTSLKNVSNVDVSKSKVVLQRKINQNTKWNNKFENLFKRVKDFENNPNDLKKIKILDECYRLNIVCD